MIILGHRPDLMGKDATVKQAHTGQRETSKKKPHPEGCGSFYLGKGDVLL